MQCPDWPSTLVKQPLHFPRPKHRQKGLGDPAHPGNAVSCRVSHIHTRCRAAPQWLIFITSFGRNYFYSTPLRLIIPHPQSWSLSIFQWDINKPLTRMSCGCLSHFISQRPCLLCLSCSFMWLSLHVTWKASQNLSICMQQFIPQWAYRSLISHLVFLFLQAEKAIRVNPPANYGSQVLFCTFVQITLYSPKTPKICVFLNSYRNLMWSVCRSKCGSNPEEQNSQGIWWKML